MVVLLAGIASFLVQTGCHWPLPVLPAMTAALVLALMTRNLVTGQQQELTRQSLSKQLREGFVHALVAFGFALVVMITVFEPDPLDREPLISWLLLWAALSVAGVGVVRVVLSGPFLATLERFNADAVVGPVLPRFPEDGPEIDAYRRHVYTRDARVPTGTPLLRWNIGNSIFNKVQCFVGAEPFLPRLGSTGGEDTVFLRQLTRRGCKMVWCGEAIAWERVPADRLEPDYLLRRAFLGAQTATFVCTMVRPRELGRALRLMVGGCAQVVLYGPAALVLKAINHERWLPVMAKAVAVGSASCSGTRAYIYECTDNPEPPPMNGPVKRVDRCSSKPPRPPQWR